MLGVEGLMAVTQAAAVPSRFHRVFLRWRDAASNALHTSRSEHAPTGARQRPYPEKKRGAEANGVLVIGDRQEARVFL
jgi:hypothetical protein